MSSKGSRGRNTRKTLILANCTHWSVYFEVLGAKNEGKRVKKGSKTGSQVGVWIWGGSGYKNKKDLFLPDSRVRDLEKWTFGGFWGSDRSGGTNEVLRFETS